MERIPEIDTDTNSISSYYDEEEEYTETEAEREKRVRFQDEEDEEASETTGESTESDESAEDEDSDDESDQEEDTPLTAGTSNSSVISENSSSAPSASSLPKIVKANGDLVNNNKNKYDQYSTPPPKYMSGPIMRSLGSNERGIDVGPEPDHYRTNNNKIKEEMERQQTRNSKDKDEEEFYFLPLKTAREGQSNNSSDPEVPLETENEMIPIKVIKPERTWKDHAYSAVLVIGKTVSLLFLLYMFVCSLDLLSLGFRLIGGRTAGEIFRKSDILQNPVVGVMIGILTTVLVQSSSTSTSIIVGMVAAGFLQVQVAIPLIMGANIGTSITNTIVSFSQAGDRDQFRLAFAGATILDMFNWITVIVLLPIEVLTGYLYHFSSAIMRGLMPDKQAGGDFQLLSVLTKPFVNLIVQLDRDVLECWSSPNCTHLQNASLIKEYCGVRQLMIKVVETVPDASGREVFDGESLTIIETNIKCDFIFAGTPLSDAAAGAIILVASLLVLCTCLILIVKVLSSVLQGQVATVIKKTLNADIPYVPWITGYLAILVGAVMTFLVQSSSVFTSAITPLIGLGVISVERAYPLTLGSNIGTTTTALIASMAVEGVSFYPSMQIALCHLLFNITGILLFYPVPFMRFPIGMAKYLGKTTAKYRWFAILYMVLMFAVLPAVTISLSLGGPIPVIVFCSLLGLLLAIVGIVTVIQRKRPSLLPERFRTWKWLPLPLRSLQPYDEFFTSFNYCRKLKAKSDNSSSSAYTKKNRSNDPDIFAQFQPQVLTESPKTRREKTNHGFQQFAEDEV